MKTIINSTFYLRGTPVSRHYSFPEYSHKVQETILSELNFLQNQNSEFTLVVERNTK